MLTATVALYAQPVPVGSEFQVNTFTPNAQALVPAGGCVASNGAGNFVVVWTSNGQDFGATDGVYGQRYNSAGVAQGGEFLVNQTVTNNQSRPAVAMDSAGNFVVVWQSQSATTGLDIYARRYNSVGTALSGEFLVNVEVNNAQQNAAVAMDDDGDFVIVWQALNHPTDASGDGIYARRYNNAGVAQGTEFRVNSTVADDQREPAVAMDANGNFVVVWQSANQDGGGLGIYGQRYDSGGATVGSEFAVNTVTAGDQALPSVAMDAGGAFVVVFESPDVDQKGVFARRYNSAGTPFASEFAVNTTTTGEQRFAAVGMNGAGQFVVAWEGPDAGGVGVFAQAFTAAGATEGSELPVNTFTTGSQTNPSVALNAAGGFVIGWQSFGQDGSDRGVYAQRYVILGPPSLALNTASADFTEDDPPVILAAASTLTATVPNLSGGFLLVEWATSIQVGDTLLVETTATVRNNGGDIEHDPSGLFSGGETVVGTVPTSGAGSGLAGAQLQISFNANCTPAIAQAVLRSVAFGSVNQDPSQALRVVQFTVDDGVASSTPVTMNLNVTSVPDAPTLTSFTLLFDLEDNPKTITYADLAAAGDQADADSAPIYFRIAALGSGTLLLNGNAALVGDDILPGDNLLWTPPADVFGTHTVASFVAWDGALASATPVDLQVSLAPVNDPPSFTHAGSVSTFAGTGPNTVAAWAGNISAGPANEAGQLLQFNVSVLGTTGTLSFVTAPAVNATTGNLTFETSGEGTAQVEVTLQDDGGGADSSAPELFTITVQGAPTVIWVNPAWAGLNYGDNPSGPATFFGVDAFATLQDAINAAQPGATILLSADTFAGATVNKSLTLQGTTGTVVRGASPALLVSSGSVVSNGIDYEVDSSPTPDDPTVLITGGDLTLSNSVVTESGSFDQAAIRLTGGAILFGAGVVLNRQGAGQLIDHQSTGAIDATGVTLQNNGAAFADNFAVEDAVFHALDSATSGLVTWVSGNVFVTTASGSIQRGIDAATAGDTVHVASGTYTGGQDINKSLTVRGPNAGTHGTSGSRVAEARVAASAILFTVSAPGVIIDGFEFYAFDTLVSRCVATSGLAFSGLDVRNNVFRRDSTTAATGFGAVFAVQVVGDGTQNVTVRRNLVTATLTGPSVTAAFSCGVLLDTTSATVGGATAADGNDIYAFEQDVLSLSAVNLTLWNNTFRGAGAEISSPMAGGLTQIQENTFNLGDPALPQSLLVKFNNTSASVLVSSNLFNNHRIGAVIAAARNVTLTGNTFNNSAAVADYTHVLFSTSWPTGGTPLPVTGCSLDLGGNTFNHVAGPTAGRALDFQNGNSASTIGAISIGSSGINTFDGSLPQYIRLQTSTLVAPLFSPATNPAPADFAFNLVAGNNLFDGVAPGAMTAAERTALETKVEHKVDNPVLGLVSFGFNNAPTLVGGPYTFTSIAEDNFASGGDEIDMTGILDDVDGPGAGIAVIGADNSNGEWEYSLNNGTSWTAFGTVSGTSAVLLAGDPANVRVRFVPDADFFGTASITIRGWDRFTGNNGDTNVDASQNGIGTAFSANTETVTITVNAVNDAPTFTASNPSAVDEDSGAQTVSGWASGFNPGPANESGQAVAAYIVTNVSNPGLFAVQPAVDASGNLTYTPAADAFGTSTFDVQVQDNGGTANGGVDTSAAQNFTITINAVNDAPTFTASNPSAVDEDSGAQTVSGWASGFNPGPANESGQTVSAYIVTNVSNPGLFAVQPAVDASGILTYTPAADAFGTSTFDVQVQDNGGTANGGVDTSAAQNFTITVNAVNDAPSLNAASYNFNSQLEDDTTQTGDDIDLSGDIIDPDGPDTGLAVIGADNSNGQWQFTLTGGGPWTNITGVSATSATLIPSGTNTRIRFIPIADFFGTAAITLRGWDQSGVHTPGQTGVDVSVNGGSTPFSANTAVATITITAVNDAPTFSASNPPAVDEDSGAQTVSGWAGGFNPGPANESGQAVAAYIVTNVSNPGLFAVQPAVDASGNLTYTPAADAFGTSTFDVQVQDNGGTANGGVDTSAAQNFTITVNAVNDAPTFSASNPPAVDEDSGAQTVSGWAGGFNPGPANESGQTVVAYIVTNVSNPGLFAVQPAVDASGNLTYTPAADAFGTSTFDVQVQDNGGTANGGVDTSAAQNFTITVNAVNDAPTFSASNPSAVDEDSGAQTVSGWASGFNPGPANESGQAVAAYIVTNVSNPGLFAVQPAVDASGNLTYTPAADAFGTSTFDVQVQDNGGTANGGVDTSAAQNFTITVNPVNDRPIFTGGANPPVVVQGTVAPTFTGWATGMSVGPTNEFLILGQTLTGFTVTPTGGTLLFTTPPAVSLAGDLSYTVDPASFGTATFTVLLHDDGGTTPGFDTSLPHVLTIEVLPTPTQVYVDAAFAGLSYGDDPAGPATFYGIDAFDNVQAGIDAVAVSGTVTVAAGTYLGANSAKSLTLDLSATPTLRGASPVLAHSSGTLTVIGGVLDQNTAFPTVALSGGALILNGVTVLESSVGDFAAIEVTGGTLDISTSGGNTVRVRGIGGLLIDNNHTANISAVGAVANVWQEDATTFSTAVLADNFAIEDRVAHATDAAGRGFVLWNSGHVYVTTSSASIQRGVDAATAGDTLHVAAGEFAGVVLIDRALTVEGAGAGQDADVRFAAFTGGKASTAAETVVTAANNKPLDPNPNAEDLIRVTASNVTIDGLVIDGNNPALGASVLQINGVEVHARYGITNIGATNSFNPVDNLMVRHCVLQNFGWRGVSVANNGPVTHGTVRENVIRNFRSQGIYTQTNAYLDIQDNTIDVPGSGVGLHWQNFSAGRAGNAVTHWRDNRISVGVNATGIHQNLTVGSASPLNIEGNLVNADAAATFADPFTIGINVWSLQGNTSTTLVNNIVGASGGQFARGINLWDLPTTTSLSITGGSVGNSGAGVHLDNVDLFLLQGAATHVTVSGLMVAATCETGVLLRSATVLTWDDTLLTLSVVTPAGNNVSMSMTGCTIAGSVEGIRVETDSTFTAALQLSGGSITGDLGLHVLGAQASASVSQTAITGSVFEAVLVDGGTAGISASTLSAGSVGLDLQYGGSLSVFANNTISAWGVAGIRVGATVGGLAAINDNAFTGTGLALENLSATAVNAQNNWWGSPTGPTEASNPGGTGGSVTSLALVGYTPWWASGSDDSVAPGFQGGDTVFSPSGEARHAIPTELAWVQQPLSPQVALVNFVPAPALRAQDTSGYLGFNFNGSVFLGFSSNPVGATTAGGTVNALDGLVSFGSFSVSLGGVFTFQGFAVGPLGNINSPVSGLVFVNNPAPVLVSVVPDWANAGSGSILLTLTGSGFNSQSQSRWNGGNRATLYVNSNTLMMALTSADLAAPGMNSIEVNNGTPGGGTSNPLNFTTNGVPSAINLTSSTVAENLPANTLVGTLSVVDAFPALDTHSLALVFGAGSSGNGSFTLVGNEVRTTASFDFEAQSSYSIRVRATDTFGAWLEAVFVISITNVNEAPVAVADTYNATEDSTLTVSASQGVIGNDSDPDGTTPTAVLSSAPVPAAAVSAFGLNSDGSFSLTPVLNFNGTITFSYHAFDGALSSAPVVVTLNFASVNDAPVAANDSYGANEDVALQVNAAAGVLANDSDLHAGAPGENNTPLTAVLVSNTSSGTISLNADGSFTYTPFANFSGADSFTYRTLDSLGAQSGVATVTINVSAVNDSPVLNAASYSFISQLEDDTAQIGDDIDLSGDVTDVDGPGTGLAVYGADNTNGQWEFTLSGGAPWTALTGLSPATARLIPSGALTRIRFVPAADFFGAAAIQFRAWDKSTGSDGQAGVDITVHGGSTAFSANSATATINILPVNDAPTLTTVSTLTGGVEDTAFTVFYSALATAADEADIDSSTISFRIESVSTGSLVLNGSAVVPGTSVFGAGDQLVWTPAADANGVIAAFTVVAWDGALASATPVQVSVNVASVNDTPSFTKGSDPGVSEDSGLQTIAGWATAISAGPADESGQSLTFVVTGNSNSALFAVQPAVSATGTLTFTPAADAFGTAQVTIVLQDNGGGADTSATQMFVITVSAVNDAPTLTAVSTLNGAVEDTPFVIFYSTLLAQADEADIDSAPVNFRIESVTSGTLTMNGGAIALGTTVFAAGDQLEWTPAANANGVLAAFMIRAWDGALASATDVQVNVSVGAANDAPTLTTVSTLTGATEDTQFVIPFATLAAAADEADVDSSPVNFRIESITSGTLTINSSAVTPGTTILASGDQLEWTPAANANGVLAAFTVRAWDGALASATAVQVSVNVTPVDDPPELVLPASGSSFVDLGGGVYRLTIDPGAVPSDAVLQVTDIDSASVDLTVTPPASLPAGITSPATNPAVTAGALLAFTGSSSTTDPLLSPYQYTFTLVGAAGPYTVQVVVNDPPPQHSVASGFGQGSAGNPYTTSVGIGGAPGVVLANVFELNTAQTISQVSSTLISPTGSPFTAGYTGAGSNGAITAQAGRTLNIGDVGNHDLSVTVTDGQTNVVVFVRVTVLNVGNVPPTSGLATGSVFTAAGANQFTLTVDPNETLAGATLVLTDADGDPLTLTSVTAAPMALGGIVPPAILVTALSPLAISFTGTVDPSFDPQDYVYSLVVTDNITAPVTITVTFTLRDLAPEHVAGPDADAVAPGTGSSADPYKVTVQAGHNTPLVMSIVTDANTGQTLSLTGVNTTAQPLVAYTFALVGTGNTGDIVITPVAPLGAADVGVWTIEFFVTDGTNPITIFVEITVLPAPHSGGGKKKDSGCSTSGHSGNSLLWVALGALGLLFRPRRRNA